MNEFSCSGPDLTLTGGNGSGSGSFGGFVPDGTGPGIMLGSSTGNQTVWAGHQILLTAGSYNNTNSGNTFYGGSVTIQAAGSQDVHAPTIMLAAGTAGHDNSASIYGGGATQDIYVTTLLDLKGGGGGNNNYSWIGAAGASGVQTIHGGTTAVITLTGGSSGGGSEHTSNDASIGLSDSNFGGSQTVYAGSITITAVSDSTTWGGAGFGNEHGLSQSFYVTGDLTMTGGGNSAGGDFKATPAYIGSKYGGAAINLFVGGNVVLNGGSGAYGGVLIGSLDNVSAPGTVNLYAGHDISAIANTGGVWLGVKNQYASYSSDVNLIAGWNGITFAPAVGVGPTGSINAAGLTAGTAGGAFNAQAYGGIALGSITTDAPNYGSDAGDVYIKAFNGTLAVNQISAQGAWGGGYGGTVTLWANGDLTVGTGGINASGGGGYNSGVVNNGRGGDGGTVLITSLTGKVAVNGDIISNGGWGGSGYSGYSGGNGGNGGSITLNSGSFISLAAGKTISSIGGTGGWGGDGGEFSPPAGNGGNGGNGSSITLNSGTYISLGANSQIIARGGDGGEGGVGGYANYLGTGGYQGGSGGTGGGGGSISLTSGTYISLGANSQIIASGGTGGTGGQGGRGAYGYSGGNGGIGGNGGNGGGSITLTATAGNVDLGSNAWIDAGGGTGGRGGQGGYGNNYSGNGYGGSGGQGGTGGNGGTIAMNANGTGGSILLGGAFLSAGGGAGGEGGTGGIGKGYNYGFAYGYGGNGGQGGTGGNGGTIAMNANGTGGTIQVGTAWVGANGGTGGYGGIGGEGRGFDHSGGYGFGIGGNGGQGGNGGNGGYVALVNGSGGISMIGGSIQARGGDGGMGGAAGQGFGYAYSGSSFHLNGQGYAGVQGLGGNGGNYGPSYWSVYLHSAGTISLSGWLDASGGNGGGYAFGGNGGNGGNGGSVYVDGGSIVANNAYFYARGGSGGNGDAYAGTPGGNGGNGGYVGLYAYPGDVMLTGSIVDVGGGNGGRGGDSINHPWWGGYGATNGGHGGNGGYGYGYAGGALRLTSSSILANGGNGGDGGHDLVGWSGGGNGGTGGTGGYVGLLAGSIAMTGSSVWANGGGGGSGGDGLGSTAVNTVVDGWGTPICGGGYGTCNGTQTLDSHGILMAFHPADGSGPATLGGSGGSGGNVYSGTAISMNATAGDITMSGDSSVYASPGGGGQGGLGWADGGVGFYYPTYPSSYIQWITWSGISNDFHSPGAPSGSGSSTAVSLNASGNISLGRVEAWDGAVAVTAGGAILDNNGSAVNIAAKDVTLTSVYGGAPGGLAISAGTEVDNLGSITATVAGGANGGIDIANTGYDLQPVSVTLIDLATNGSATFRQNFTAPSATLYGAGITLIAQPGGFVGLASNRDLSFDGVGYGVFTAGGGGTIGFAANNGSLNINGALAGGTDSVELSAGTLNISAPVSGANITLDVASTINLSAATTATGDFVAGANVMNINNAIIASNVTAAASVIGGVGSITASADAILIGTSAINIGSGISVQGANVFLGGGALNLLGANVTATAGNVEFNLGSVNGTGGYISASNDITGIVAGNITLDNGSYFAAGNDVSLSFKGGTSMISLSNGGYVFATNPHTISLAFAARSSGGVMIDGVEKITSLPGGSGFFVVDHNTPAAPGAGLDIKYALSDTGGGDLCALSPALCKPPEPPPVDPCVADPTLCKKPDEDKNKNVCTGDSFDCDDNQNGKKDDKPAPKHVGQCSA